MKIEDLSSELVKAAHGVLEAKGKLPAGWKGVPVAKSARQLVNPKKEIMVVKNNQVIVIGKQHWDYYKKSGWGLAEDFEATVDEATVIEASLGGKEKKIVAAAVKQAKKDRDVKSAKDKDDIETYMEYTGMDMIDQLPGVSALNNDTLNLVYSAVYKELSKKLPD